jgi:hypothetical protein
MYFTIYWGDTLANAHAHTLSLDRCNAFQFTVQRSITIVLTVVPPMAIPDWLNIYIPFVVLKMYRCMYECASVSVYLYEKSKDYIFVQRDRKNM